MPLPGNYRNTIPSLFYGSGSGAGAASASGSAGGSSKSSATFAPGQSAIFTPDPTVNGPWTHTDAFTPLFKPLPATPAPAPSAPAPTPLANGAMTRPVVPGGKMPPQPRPPSNPSPPGFQDFNRQWVPKQPKGNGMNRRRAMLADALSRD